MKFCTYEGCRSRNKKHYGRGLCASCWKRLYVRGTLEYAYRVEKTCTIDDCDDRAVAHGLCRRHYRADRLYGDPLATKPYGRTSCEIPGCSKPHRARGLCASHYMQRRHMLRNTVRYPLLPRLSAGPLEDYIAQHFGSLNAHELARLIHGSSEPDIRMARDLKLGRKGTIRQADADRICVALGITPDHIWPVEELMSA